MLPARSRPSPPTAVTLSITSTERKFTRVPLGTTWFDIGTGSITMGTSFPHAMLHACQGSTSPSRSLPVALARRLAGILYAMWRDSAPYRHEGPRAPFTAWACEQQLDHARDIDEGLRQGRDALDSIRQAMLVMRHHGRSAARRLQRVESSARSLGIMTSRRNGAARAHCPKPGNRRTARAHCHCRSVRDFES